MLLCSTFEKPYIYSAINYICVVQCKSSSGSDCCDALVDRCEAYWGDKLNRSQFFNWNEGNTVSDSTSISGWLIVENRWACSCMSCSWCVTPGRGCFRRIYTEQNKPNQKSEKPKQSFVFSEPQLSKTQYSVVSKVIEKCLSLLLQQ